MLPSPAKKTYTDQAGAARDHPAPPHFNVEVRIVGVHFWLRKKRTFALAGPGASPATLKCGGTGRCLPMVARVGGCAFFSQGTGNKCVCFGNCHTDGRILHVLESRFLATTLARVHSVTLGARVLHVQRALCACVGKARWRACKAHTHARGWVSRRMGGSAGR